MMQTGQHKGLGPRAIARLFDPPISPSTPSRWLAGRSRPSPLALAQSEKLGITLDLPPTRLGRWKFPSGNAVTVYIAGGRGARRVTARWKWARPLTEPDQQFYCGVITPAVTARVGEFLELSVPANSR